MKTWLLALLMIWSASASGQEPIQRALAVTFDDLPFASVPTEDPAALEDMTQRLLQDAQHAKVPAVGFINEAKLYRQGVLDPSRVALLQHWLDAGFELGNHTYSHLSLNRSSLDAFEADVLRGEAVTRPLVESQGRSLRWFRHPFLHLGTTPEIRMVLQQFLDAHGYRVAPVTVNNAEWIFASAYARAQGQGNQEAVRRIGAAYVPYMDAVFRENEALALDLFGRPISHVLLLHANSLNADYFSQLADMLRGRGYRFVTLDEATKDPAYASLLGFGGPEGESWLERWGRHVGLRPSPEPAVPRFVVQWAGATAVRGY
jgi:peptidoglycan/xylan/chitin deacetylase (PgdA/CDA1 family)